MKTYREIIYMILDEIKLISDDSYFEEEHVIFLMDAWRSTLLSQRYGDVRRDVSSDNYQTICADLESTLTMNGGPCQKGYMRTTVQVPNIISIGSPRVHSADFFQGDISLVSFNRFKYVGHNKFLRNALYATIAPDRYLYIRSANPQHQHMEQIMLTGVFMDPSAAFDLRCDRDLDDSECDILDMPFPLEAKLIPDLIQVVVRELLGASYRPQDSKNNSADDLSELANFLRNVTTRDFQRSLTGEDREDSR